MGDAPGVIILGNEYQALGLLRQLSSQGISCALVDQDAWGVARLSRFRCPFFQSPRYTSAHFWPWLRQLAHSRGYAGWVLIPTDDEQVRQLAEHYKDVRALFRYAGLPWQTYQLIYNKRLAYPWAHNLGVAVPASYIPAQRTDGPGEGWAYPLIIKPAIKREYSRHTKKKAIRVTSLAHLQSVLHNELAAVPIEELLYQEIVPGDGSWQWSYAGLFVDGQPVAAYTACRRRQHPPDFGRASTFVVAEHDAEVERLSRRIVSALNYTGLAEVEWKRDARTGECKFLEVNARSWGWHSLSAAVVGNLPLMLYRYLVHQQAQGVEPRYGARWVKWVTDIPVGVMLWRHGELSWHEYLASVRNGVVCCEWERRDPWPFFLQAFLLPYLSAKRGF